MQEIEPMGRIGSADGRLPAQIVVVVRIGVSGGADTTPAPCAAPFSSKKQGVIAERATRPLIPLSPRTERACGRFGEPSLPKLVIHRNMRKICHTRVFFQRIFTGAARFGVRW